MTARRTTAAVAALILAVTCAPAARTGAWELSTDRYKVMNAFERAQYDKAAGLFKEGNYKAAAPEFEKFIAQFPDSPNLSYMVLMRARSLHMAKTRHEAIKIYDEVLDYFADVVEDAAAAMYYKALAHIENGDVIRGMTCLKQMVEDERYGKHPFAAGALRQLADYHWSRGEEELAIAYWKQTVREFGRANPPEAGAARDNVTDWYIKKPDLAGYERWLVDEDKQDDPRHRQWIVDYAWGRAFHNFHHAWGKYEGEAAKLKRDDMKAFYEYLQSRKSWYEKSGDLWRYYHNAIYFVVHRMGDRKETEVVIDQCVKYIETLKDDADPQGKYSWIVDRLREGGDFFRARYVASRLKDKYLREWKEYEIRTGEGKWKEAVSKLVEIEGMGDADWRARAEETRAHIYHHYLQDYQKAIELYQQINKPPGTLWNIQDCYHRWGKLREALNVLAEIESSFPPDAPNAAWHTAAYLDQAGNKELAIAAARKIMKKYPNSGASSNAHQLLEKYGIRTGGGVIDED